MPTTPNNSHASRNMPQQSDKPAKPRAKGRNRPKLKDDAGRPTKLTQAMADKIVTLSSSLASDAAICRAVRISPHTFVDWKARAAEGRQPYKGLFDRIDEAQAIQEIDLINKIASDPDWRAKAWTLERRARGYENRQKHEHTGKDGKELPPSAMPPITVTITGGAPGHTIENPYAPQQQG